MPKPSLGTKRICPNCHQPFYDLQKSPAHCPNCSHEFDPAEMLRGKRTRGNEPAAKAEEVKSTKKTAGGDIPDIEEIGEAEETEDAEDEVLEDASDLGEDDEDVSGVIENVDGAGEER